MHRAHRQARGSQGAMQPDQTMDLIPDTLFRGWDCREFHRRSLKTVCQIHARRGIEKACVEIQVPTPVFIRLRQSHRVVEINPKAVIKRFPNLGVPWAINSISGQVPSTLFEALGRSKSKGTSINSSRINVSVSKNTNGTSFGICAKHSILLP